MKETVAEQRKKVEAATELGEEQKNKLRQLYEQASVELNNAETFAGKAAEYQKAVKAAPAEIERLKETLGKTRAEYALPTPRPPLEQLQKTLTETETKLETAKQTLAQADKAVTERGSRQAAIPKTIADRTAELDTLRGQLSAITSADTPEQLASRAALQARQAAVSLELESLRQESAAVEAQANLLPLRRDEAAVYANYYEKVAVIQREAVAAARQEQADAAAAKTRREAQRQSIPVLKAVADENQTLAAERVDTLADAPNAKPKLGVPSQIKEVDAQIAEANKLLQSIKKQSTSVRNDVDTVGLSTAVAALLRQDRLTLPDTRRLDREIASRQDATAAARFQWLRKSDKRFELGDISAEVNLRLEEARKTGIANEAEIKENLESLLTSQRDLLDNLISDYDELFRKLVELSVVQEKLINETEEYRAFIDERILWAVSTTPLDLQSFAAAYQSARELGTAANWTADLWKSLKRRPVAAASLAISLLLIPLAFPLQKTLRRRIILAGQAAKKRAATDFSPTLQALVATLILSLLWAAIAWITTWQLGRLVMVGEGLFWPALLIGVRHTAVYLVPFQFIRQICRPSGLAEAHFDWPASTAAVIRHSTQTMMTVTTPFVLMVTALRQLTEEVHSDGSSTNDSLGQDSLLRQLTEEVDSDGLGRLAFLLVMIALSTYVAYLFRPRGEVASGLQLSRNDNLLRKVDVIWYPLLIILPLGLAVAASMGYYYTAFQLAIRFLASLLLLVFFFVFAGIADRSLLIIRRRLAMKRYREKRAQEAGENTDGSGGSAMAASVENEVSLTQVDQETRRIVKAILTVSLLLTLWLAWVDVIPALGVLRRIELWSTTVERSIDFTQDDGTTVTRLVTQKQPVSLAGALLAMLIVSMTWIASRNVTGVVEILGSSRLAIDRGTRYAMATMARYALIVIGIVTAAHVVGIGWSKVQWLVAGAAVGLGFGLQEIFANLVSGLMILIERPIRVGDVITVDSISGVVNRIRIRATTITVFDRKELIIPNKEFITQRVMNWTLSDQVTRIDVPVGVAYGSDTGLTRQILRDIVTSHPQVLRDPEPTVFFEQFGDSTLNFTVRAFVGQLDHRLPTIHDLHVAIDNAFREAKIEIAFPQRDLHIRSLPAGLGQPYGGSQGHGNGHHAPSSPPASQGGKGV